MSKNRYIFETTLEGFINLGEPSGKFNNCCFAFRLTPDVLEQASKDREELLDWARTKVENPKRIALNPEKWDDEGLVKFSFDGDTGRARPVFVDSSGDVIPLAVLKSVSRGTKVKIACQQTPYTKPAMGTTIKVIGVQVIELATMNGAVDSGNLSVEDVASLFGTTEGFKADSPQVRDEREPVAAEGTYDF
jgi:hypothetical protein